MQLAVSRGCPQDTGRQCLEDMIPNMCVSESLAPSLSAAHASNRPAHSGLAVPKIQHLILLQEYAVTAATCTQWQVQSLWQQAER